MSTQSSLDLPTSSSHVTVSIVDTTFRLRGTPTSAFMGPEIKGFETFLAGAFAFLVTHSDPSSGKERKILFDLGPPKDWQNDLPDTVVANLSSWGAEFAMDKYVSEVLEDNGVDLNTLEAVVWSHPHFDHTGRVSLFPPTTKIITGPGLVEAYSPGYPENPNSPILSRDFANRTIEELDFNTSNLTIGSFKAIDYFQDGSFYFLDAPGHSIAHINALARTTPTTNIQPSTFILMGADSFHHTSQLRPNRHLHLPESINLPDFNPYPCPGSHFHPIHPSNPSRSKTIPEHYKPQIQSLLSDPDKTPFFTISSDPEGKTVAVDLQAAKDTIWGLQDFDADDNVLVIAAHDWSLYGVVELLPKLANDWKEKGWKEEGKWRFLRDLNTAVGIAKGGD